jgi:hypothetical protein
VDSFVGEKWEIYFKKWGKNEEKNTGILEKIREKWGKKYFTI